MATGISPIAWSLAFREADLPPFSADRPLFTPAAARRMKALLCGAFVSGADYLLLDRAYQPSGPPGQEWLYHQLESWQGGALIASHDRELLTRMPRIIELTRRRRSARSYGGNAEYRRQREAKGATGRAQPLDHARRPRRRRTRARRYQRSMTPPSGGARRSGALRTIST